MTQRFTINDWLVEPSLNRISRGDEIVKIDPQNMKVLELLASRPGEVFSQTEIEQCAWPGVVVTPNSVYQSIAQLRRALGDDKVHPGTSRQFRGGDTAWLAAWPTGQRETLPQVRSIGAR